MCRWHYKHKYSHSLWRSMTPQIYMICRGHSHYKNKFSYSLWRSMTPQIHMFCRGHWHYKHKDSHKQECIPVGCVPSAAAAVCWRVSASVHAGIHSPLGQGLDTPGPGPRHSPGPGPGHRPWADSSPWAWAWTPLLCGQTDTCENITFGIFICGR